MENKLDDQVVHIMGVIEALLFVSEKPLALEQIKKVLETVPVSDIKNAIGLLSKQFEDNKRGMAIVEIAGGYQMLSNPLYVNYMKNFYKTKHKEKLSKPALEALAIIAYKQPVTRSDIELIRGVNSDGVVNHLSGKELIKIVGRKDIAGKPFIYGTTKQFLEYFGLKSLDDLPKIEEFKALAEDKQKDLPEGAGEELGNDQGIPEEVVPMNSLEKVKQSAIVEQNLNQDSEIIEQQKEQSGLQLQLDLERREEEDVQSDQSEILVSQTSENESNQIITAVMEQDEKE